MHVHILLVIRYVVIEQGEPIKTVLPIKIVQALSVDVNIAKILDT